MDSEQRIYRTGFGNKSFEITGNNKDALSIAEFLFKDFPGSEASQAVTRYTIISSGTAPRLSLQIGDKQLYSGNSRYQLAYTLINEVIFHSINANDSHHALHAGCVYRGDRCFILPGQSGNGKSTLTSWLVMNGFKYLTDELVFLDSDARALPMTRPISLKVGPSHPSWLLSGEHNDIITSDTGSMIPHRLFNADFTPKQPKVTDIIFPQFKPGASVELQRVSPAKSSLYLLRSHVNARNLEGHGVSELTSIVRQCQSFTLHYANFADLRSIFNEKSELFA